MDHILQGDCYQSYHGFREISIGLDSDNS